MGKIKLAVVDDHQLFRKGLISVIEQVDDNFEVAWEAGNGIEFLERLKTKEKPDMVIMDVNMPGMDGFATLQALKEVEDRPPVLVLTMLDDDITLIRLLKLGAKGFMTKDVEPDELKTAIHSVSSKGDYFNADLAGKLVNVLNDDVHNSDFLNLNDLERKFIHFAASEMSYAEIGEKMNMSKKTVDNYRASTFQKLEVKTRVGLVIAALRFHIISLEEIS